MPCVAALRLPQPAGVVAALDAREPHPAQLVERPPEVAQREAGDRDQLARQAEPLGAAQDLRRAASSRRARRWRARRASPWRRSPNASHSPSSADERQHDDEQHERRLDHQPPGQHARVDVARRSRPRQQQRGVERVRPHELAARDERDGDARTGSSPAPCTRRARGAAASRPSRRPPGVRLAHSGSPPSRARGDHGREVRRGAVRGGQRLAGAAELLAVDGVAAGVADRSQHRGQVAAALVDDHGVEAAPARRAARRRPRCRGPARAARRPRRARCPSARRGPASR